MAQSEVYELLKNRYLSGDRNYYSVREVLLMLNNNDIKITKSRVNNSLLKLRVFGFLDIKMDRKLSRVNVPYPVVKYRFRIQDID
jgi:hypothetical protein